MRHPIHAVLDVRAPLRHTHPARWLADAQNWLRENPCTPDYEFESVFESLPWETRCELVAKAIRRLLELLPDFADVLPEWLDDVRDALTYLAGARRVRRAILDRVGPVSANFEHDILQAAFVSPVPPHRLIRDWAKLSLRHMLDPDAVRRPRHAHLRLREWPGKTRFHLGGAVNTLLQGFGRSGPLAGHFVVSEWLKEIAAFELWALELD